MLTDAGRAYDALSMEPDSPPTRPQARGIYLLPNLLTTGCLFSGFYAIIAAIDGNFERAGMAVFIAMIFDGLDGRVARLTATTTAFGKEYDSLADMIAFGIAPAIVTYQWGVARIAEYGRAWYRFGWLAAFFYAAAAALRLAKFNSRVQDKRYFEGLPSPSAAAVVAAFLWMSSEWREPGLPGLILAFLITAAAGALMVSRFAYPSFKSFDLARPVRFIWLVVVALIIVVIAPYPATVLLVIFGTYSLWAPLQWLLRRGRRGRRHERTAAPAVPPALSGPASAGSASDSAPAPPPGAPGSQP
ncbi:MAG TPA: CDP-diacylglycerol--serine O-phosphatidyltransferase [Steroidobacteraceae bacterium]|nr:CDP-diacylglycerol--serine O-phosphatidyltransferase [Steroidobacteraceae bacterium]